METAPDISGIAALLAEPARARMIASLLDGRALPATELAFAANISPQTASNHLSKLLSSQLLRVETQGRHRYYHLSGPEVAQAVEALASLIPHARLKQQTQGPEQQNLQFVRHCYSHLAGTLAVDIAAKLLERRLLVVHSAKFYRVTRSGMLWFGDLGIDIPALGSKKTGLAKKCLDWTERRYHLAGPLGVALFRQFISQGWISKRRNSRAMRITEKGRVELERRLALVISPKAF